MALRAQPNLRSGGDCNSSRKAKRGDSVLVRSNWRMFVSDVLLNGIRYDLVCMCGKQQH